MGQLTREFNWESTAVGPPEYWPQSLRTILSAILNSRFPMFLWWGPELICFYNDAYRPSLGQNGKHPSILGQKAALAWAEIWDIIRPLIDQVLTSGEPTWSEDQLIPIYRNGKIEDVYWTFSYSPVNDESGKPAGVLVTCTETTEKVNNLRQLRESKDQLSLAIEAAELGTWDYNPATRRFSANDRLKEWFGLRSGQDIDLALALEAIVEEDRTRVSDAIQRALEYSSGGLYDIEYTIISSTTGQKRAVRARGMAEFNDARSAVRLNGTLLDITQHVRSREVLKESEQRFQAAVKAVKGIVWTNNAKGEMEGEQAAWASLTGQHFEEYQGYGWSKAVHPDDAQPTIDAWQEALKNRGTFNFEHRVRMKNGKWGHFAVQAVPILDPAGNIREWVGVHTDIHDQKESEEKLEALVLQRTADLERSNEDLEQFAHVASHDLKEPVRKIKMFANRLAEEMSDILPERGKSYLQRIQVAAERMLNMIEGVLAYSSNDRSQVQIGKVQLQDVVRDIKTDLDMLFHQKRAQLLYEELPVFEGAGVLIYQLFYNLINNSLKFVRPGAMPEIHITSENVSIAGKEYVRIRVSDNGIGFKQENAHRIFESFARLHPKDKYEGTGLGLALCKKIVFRHHGFITGFGELNKGATFEVTLPVTQENRSL